MSDELDEFLRQAAERRRMRQQEKAARPPIATPAPQAPPPQPAVRREPAPVRTLQPSAANDAYERSDTTRSATPPQQPLPEARRLQSQFEKPATAPAAFPQEKRPPRKKQPAATPRKLGDNSPLTSSLSLQASIAEEESSFSQPRTQNKINSVNAQSIAELLRNPNSVPLGTILVLGEVLKRPWE